MENIAKITVFLFLISLSACKRTEISPYNNKLNQRSIYFPTTEISNNLVVSFGYVKSEIKDSILKIVVRTMGEPEGTDQPYKLIVADSSTMVPGEDYTILEAPLRIRAGKVADTLKIKFNRTQKLQKDSLFLNLELQPNEHFNNSYLNREIVSGQTTQTKHYTKLRIKIDDMAGPPPFWAPGNRYYLTTNSELGPFSTLKFQLVLTLFNLNIAELTQPDWMAKNGNLFRLYGYSSGLKAYLNRMIFEGTPVYEADGKTLMKVGPNAQ